MPITKDSYLRYRVLDKCFRNPVGRYTIKKLLDKCNEALSFKDRNRVSVRTIRYDIAFMKSDEIWNAPIVAIRDGHECYYQYSDLSFSIDKVPLSEPQMKMLQSAVDVLRLVDGMPQYEALGDCLDKIGLLTYDTTAQPCFGLDHNSVIAGREYISPLFDAIQYKMVIKIPYKPFDKPKETLTFHPQFLKQYNNRWYIFGMEQDHPKEIWNLALDRIVGKIKPTDLPYTELEVNWKEYFDDIIGVTNYEGQKIEKVHFIAHGLTSYYIETKPLHSCQHQRRIDKDTLDVTLKVKINQELKNILLSYAPSITILAPQSLVEEHKESLRKALEQYKGISKNQTKENSYGV